MPSYSSIRESKKILTERKKAKLTNARFYPVKKPSETQNAWFISQRKLKTIAKRFEGINKIKSELPANVRKMVERSIYEFENKIKEGIPENKILDELLSLEAIIQNKINNK
jgi:hypothetical protein